MPKAHLEEALTLIQTALWTYDTRVFPSNGVEREVLLKTIIGELGVAWDRGYNAGHRDARDGVL